VRRGTLWQPDLFGPPAGRVAGRRSLAGRLGVRSIRLRLPRWSARWRQALLLASALTLASVGAWWLYHSPLLSIREVTVEGTRTLSVDVVRDAADLEGMSIVRPDFSAARERLLALPMVKDVSIGRDWPSGARVTVAERSAWGVWAAGAQRYVIDEEGVVLNIPPPQRGPVIVQTDSVPALAPGDRVDSGAVGVARELALTAQQALGRRLVALEFSQASGLTVVLAGGPGQPELRAAFGDAQGYDFKLAALYTVIRQADTADRPLRSVDLRFGDRVAVQ
jgi:cell division protein FtsQ